MAVISPFTRTMETSLALIGPEILPKRGRRRALPTYLQPLAAEHSLRASKLMAGDRGSTATELRAQERFAMFDMTPLDRYCETRGIESTKKERIGRWWHHGMRSFETKGGFKRRCLELKQWLASVPRDIQDGAATLILVSHGGVLRESFKFDPPNCGFVVMDILPDGTSVHVATGDRKTGSFEGIGQSDEAPFEVFSVSLCDKDGYALGVKASPSSDPNYEIHLGLEGEEVTFVASESLLRTQVHEASHPASYDF